MKFPIQPFEVGPILGAVSGNTARIWGRGPEIRSGNALRRLFGAARIRKKGARFRPPQFFKLNPNFDLTGVTVFHDLDADSEYEYEAGVLLSDLEFGDLAEARPGWNAAHRQLFRTASNDHAAPRSLVFGSCRYLLKLFGGSWFDDRGDKTFRSVNEQIDRDQPLNQLLMLGDQIYADDLNFLLPDQTADDYCKRYRDVFAQEHFSRLVRRVPTYMTLDDHEIEDNWPSRASGQDLMRKFPAAIHAYLSYQLSHSPLFDFGSDGRLRGTPSRYWYQFEDGCCEFFVMDTRTERLYGDDGARLRIISPEQMAALKDWLADGSGRVKLIATPIPFFPDLRGPGRDRWDSFPEQRNEILEHIHTNAIPRTVFLSGDVHSSMTAELRHRDDAAFKVISVVCSPFYWPYPHSFVGDFQLSGTLAHTEGYRLRRAGPVHSTDNFARVSVGPERIRVEFFARKGQRLGAAKTHGF